MKIPLVALVGLVVGLGAGTGPSALRAKGEILESRARAHADSLAAARGAGPGAVPGAGYGDEGALTVVLPPEDVEATPDSTGAAHVEAGAPGQPADSVSPGGPPDEAPPSAAEPVAADSLVGAPGVADLEAEGRDGSAPSALSADGAKKLAKIFAAMKPADAAAVLAGMTDEEVTAILAQMTDRQAGPVVSAFDAERAAALSSMILRVRGGGA